MFYMRSVEQSGTIVFSFKTKQKIVKLESAPKSSIRKVSNRAHGWDYNSTSTSSQRNTFLNLRALASRRKRYNLWAQFRKKTNGIVSFSNGRYWESHSYTRVARREYQFLEQIVNNARSTFFTNEEDTVSKLANKCVLTSSSILQNTKYLLTGTYVYAWNSSVFCFVRLFCEVAPLDCSCCSSLVFLVFDCFFTWIPMYK